MFKNILSAGLLSFSFHCYSLTPQQALGDAYIARAEWGTEKDYKTLDVSYDGQKNLISLHHIPGSSHFYTEMGIPADREADIVRQVELKHVHARKFADIGFHYIVGPSGNVYECRHLDVQGAHTLKLNAKNVGVALMGCYDETACESEGYKLNVLTEEMIDSTARLAAYVSIVENFVLSANNLVARSVYEQEKLGYSIAVSPGQSVVERLDEILSKALSHREAFLKLETKTEL